MMSTVDSSPTRNPDRVASAEAVRALREGKVVLEDITLHVRSGEHWALLGPNGAGKSSLLSILGGWRFPSSGSVFLLGSQLGTSDLRELRRGIGWVDPMLVIRPDVCVLDAVLTGATATTDLLPRREIPATERSRARELAKLMGLADRLDHRYGALSTGERGRTLVARALLPSPQLLLLDEPFTGLDLPGREQLRLRLAALAAEQPDLASVTVTHHLEELPASTTHAALLRAGRLVAAGPVGDVLTGDTLTETFGMALEVHRTSGRWLASAGAGLTTQTGKLSVANESQRTSRLSSKMK